MPPDDDAPCKAAIGLGPLSLVVAEDREEDRKARVRLLANGRPVPAGGRRLKRRAAKREATPGRAEELFALTQGQWENRAVVGEISLTAISGPIDLSGGVFMIGEEVALNIGRRPTRYEVGPVGGYLSADFQPCKQSSNGSRGGARGLSTIDLSADVAAAIRSAKLAPAELEDLLALHVGRWQKPSKKQRRGDLGDERAAAQEVLTSPLLSELARARGIELTALRDRLSAARGRLCVQLERRGLIPGVRDAEEGLPPRRAKRGRRPAFDPFASAVAL